MYWYRNREQEFTGYFSQDSDLVCCCNIPKLVQKFGIEYKSECVATFHGLFQKKLKSCPVAQRQQLRFIACRPVSCELVLTKTECTAHD
jgi:hypothetical protein